MIGPLIFTRFTQTTPTINNPLPLSQIKIFPKTADKTKKVALRCALTPIYSSKEHNYSEPSQSSIIIRTYTDNKMKQQWSITYFTSEVAKQNSFLFKIILMKKNHYHCSSI